MTLARTFSQADSNPSIRQVYEISQLGEPNKKTVITPQWMKVEAKRWQTVDAKDFRDELHLTDNKNLIFSLSVASKRINDKKDWKEIGTITLDTSIVSKSCDHRLHFHHAKERNFINHTLLKFLS